MKRQSFRYTKEFDEKNEYTGEDLGAVCGHGQTSFKVWAPFADSLRLCLYRDGGEAITVTAEDSLREADRVLEMQKAERGVWAVTLPEELHGSYYDFLAETEGETVRTADPYAKACCCNGQRSMVVDLSRTDPVGFGRDHAPERASETVIYELHIKDFSYDADSRVPQAYRGKYKAFTVTPAAGEYPVGVEYLKKLGITHVHLLPCYDFGWLDEAGADSQFNWGYDPVNYNVPEGSFATDAKDGTVRIREFKEMIMALHQAGIRVVMDVVYNHTYEPDSWLERLAPGYFCRRNADGSLSDGAACGSDMAAGRAMADRYIVDSVRYWAREYHIDGFRFDLMGLLTTELMNRIRETLDAEYGEGEKLLYGEAWRAKESPMEAGTHAALKENIRLLSENIAVFSDDTRDVIKGDVFYPKIPGFVNGGRELEDRLLDAVTGWRDNIDGFCPKSCNQIVNYVSAHDNHTLWDKLLLTMREEAMADRADCLKPYPDILTANKLAALIYFTCQGHLFLQAGEEFGRTKFGDENSFRSAPEINMLRWAQTERFGELLEYYRGLISLRKKLPGLCDKSAGACYRISRKTVHREKIVSFVVDNRSEDGSLWDMLYIIYNASGQEFRLTLPCEERGEIPPNWEILADDRAADCSRQVKETVVVAAESGMILGKRAMTAGNEDSSAAPCEMEKQTDGE